MTEIITRDDSVLRRVNFQDPKNIRPDGKPSSYAFLPRKDKDKEGLSVDLERVADYDISIEDETKYMLFQLSAEIPMDLGLTLKHDPKKYNHAHSLMKEIRQLTRGVRKKLSKACIEYPRP